MGDPSAFSIKRGANPHTRTRWGFRKKVDLPKAIDQWHRMKETLEQYGIQVHVVPADPELPGLVFPANAGVRVGDKYIMATLNPERARERDSYEKVIRPLGLTIEHVENQFEGEADFIPWGDQFIFTHGKIIKQRFVPRFGFPPWKRRYGFRTDIKALGELILWVPMEKIIPIELKLEEFYHGDTIFCAFGANRERLLAYRKGMKPAVMPLRNGISSHIIWISDKEAKVFLANSFQTIHREEPVLFVPQGSVYESRQEILKKGAQIVEIDVSEFFEKGGGSVKCMIGDLGIMPS